MSTLEYFNPGQCDRCLAPMTAWIDSFFKEEKICMDCVIGESEVIAELKQAGEDPRAYAGAGFIPAVTPVQTKVS